MKPRNKHEQHVAQLSAKLPPITTKQRQWAFDHCFDTDSYINKGEVWCLHCGRVFTPDSEPGAQIASCTCPDCHRQLHPRQSRKQKYHESAYYTILTTFRGFQVCRHFIVFKSLRKGGIYPYYSIDEAVQNWIHHTGKETIIARPCKQSLYYNDLWDFCEPMSIKNPDDSYRYGGYGTDKYTIEAKYIYPHRSILPIIRRNGYTARFHGIAPNKLFSMILTDRKAETLIKNSQFDLLRILYKRGIPSHIMPTIRIANRHRYIIKDASMWIDYIELLSHFRLDTHNPHYICPANLKLQHDILMSRKLRIERKRKVEENLRKAEQWEKDYKQSKGKYFGITFSNGDITITVITSVAEMAEEGTEMHHCVFANNYYKKADSLILSAKDKKGNRIETIEVNLKTFQIVQSKGKFNENTPHHTEIINLVNQNINLIKKIS